MKDETYTLKNILQLPERFRSFAIVFIEATAND